MQALKGFDSRRGMENQMKWAMEQGNAPIQFKSIQFNSTISSSSAKGHPATADQMLTRRNWSGEVKRWRWISHEDGNQTDPQGARAYAAFITTHVSQGFLYFTDQY